MEPEAEQQPKSLTEIARFAEKRFNEICPAEMKFGSELSFAFQILQDKPNLMAVAKETPRSLVSVLQSLAAIGLSLNPAKKEAYLLSRNIKIRKEGKEVWESRLFLEPSYMGLNKVATDTGAIEWVQAKVVRKQDECIDNGVGLRVTHKYDTFGTNESRGPIVGCYCTVKLPSGDFLTKFVNKERLDDIRGRSGTWKKSLEKGGNGDGTWLTDEEEMVMKATMRTSFKTWPKTDRFQRLEQAVHLSNENEDFEPLITSPEITSFTAQQKGYFDQLITDNDSLRMFCFFPQLEEGVQSNLWNSFEKGNKGKYQTIVNNLVEAGRSKIEDYKLSFAEYLELDDNDGCIELLEDFPQEALDFILDKANSELATFIRGNQAD